MSVLSRRATSDDVDEVVDILTEGFAREPVLSWIYETREQYSRLAPSFFRWLTERTLAVGDVHVFGDGYGVVLGQHSDTLKLTEEQGQEIQRQLRVVGAECADRLLLLMDTLTKNHPMAGPHWCCTFGAMRVAHQRQGLFSPTLSRLYREKTIPCYAETTTPGSRVAGERAGFRAVGEFHLADDLYLCAMWRLPDAHR